MRPLPVVVSTLWWSALTVLAFAYATYVDVTLGGGILGILILTVLFFLTCSVLWFLWSYWQGQDWTRTFVIVGLILKAAFYLRQASYFYRTTRCIGGFSPPVRAVDLIFSVYVFYWLMTKKARTYFTFKARTTDTQGFS
jgi:hypothetical protein